MILGPSHARPGKRHQLHRRKRSGTEPVELARVKLSSNIVKNLLGVVLGLCRISIVFQRGREDVLSGIPRRASGETFHQLLRFYVLPQSPIHLRQRHFYLRVVRSKSGRQFRPRVGIVF